MMKPSSGRTIEKFFSNPKNDEYKKHRDELIARCTSINKTLFGNDHFRSKQLETILDTLEGKDVFVVMPTGGGKSLCYALPAVMSAGVTVVISPLISLIEDQVSGFIQRGIPAAFLTSCSTKDMITSVFTDLSRGRNGLQPFLKLLYVTPERIVNSARTFEIFQELYNNEILARFVIDESHCLSQWGHDFRKDYGKLNILKKKYPKVPIIALTATARNSVRKDILKMLDIPNSNVHSAGFERVNLFFEVIEKVNPRDEEATMLQMYQYIQEHNMVQDTGIVYCMTKAGCEHMADFLREQGISADYYHAGQSQKDRNTVQGAWLRGDIKVVCATIAYGMGIDKSNVRYVIHFSLAKSIEGYYQEAGRAGRDGLPSRCVIFYHVADVSKLKRIMSQPPRRKISQKDQSFLDEIQQYCESSSCRRKSFADIFFADASPNLSSSSSSSSSATTTTSCNKMCDNCKKRSEGVPIVSVGLKPKGGFAKASTLSEIKGDAGDWVEPKVQRTNPVNKPVVEDDDYLQAARGFPSKLMTGMLPNRSIPLPPGKSNFMAALGATRTSLPSSIPNSKRLCSNDIRATVSGSATRMSEKIPTNPSVEFVDLS